LLRIDEGNARCTPPVVALVTPAKTSSWTYVYALLAATLVGIGLLRDPTADVVQSGAPPGGTPKVQFVGNATVSSDRLRAAIAEYPLFDDAGTIIQEVLERDLLLISAFYWDHGHAQVKVGEPVIPSSRDAVTIPIEEGPVFTMGAVAVTGELIGSAKANLRRVRVRPGVTFSRIMIANDREALSDFYQDQGYAYVNVLPLTKLDLARKTIGLTFEISRGKRAYFERIEVDGNSKTPTRTIRRAMKIAEGDQFTNMELVEGKRRVESLGFDEVAISTKRGSSDELVVVTIEVQEFP
jgi:outer membrane protein insertion porin family